MKVVILAGGLPSTISDEKGGIPKPMAELGGRPLLWHIMKMFSHYGFCEFIICGGYKVNLIKEYFKDFYIYQSDITIDLKNNDVIIHRLCTEDWKVTVVDTGLEASTGERILQAKPYIGDEDFIVTYGDCLSDIHVTDMVNLHKEKYPMVTMAVARPTGRHAVLSIDENNGYLNYTDSISLGAWVNASCYVLSGQIFNQLGKNELNEEFMEQIAQSEQVLTYRHNGFWSPVETKRDSNALEVLWEKNEAPWKVWDDGE